MNPNTKGLNQKDVCLLPRLPISPLPEWAVPRARFPFSFWIFFVLELIFFPCRPKRYPATGIWSLTLPHDPANPAHALFLVVGATRWIAITVSVPAMASATTSRASSAADRGMSVRLAHYWVDTRDDLCVILVRNTNCEQNWQAGMHLLDFLIHSPSSGSNGAAIGTIPSSNSLNLLSVASTATPTTKDTTEKETIDTTGIEVNNEKKTSSINVWPLYSS